MSSIIQMGSQYSGNNAAWSHTTPAGLVNNAVVVLIGTHQGTISSVDFGGSPMTKIAEGASGFNECGDIWIILAPGAGTVTITPTMSGGSWWGGMSINLSNIKQTTTVTNATANGTSSFPQATVTSPTYDNLIMAAVGTEAVPTPNQIPFPSLQGQSFENAGFEFAIGGDPRARALDFTNNSGQRFGMAIASFEPANPPTNRIFSTLRPAIYKPGLAR